MDAQQSEDRKLHYAKVGSDAQWMGVAVAVVAATIALGAYQAAVTEQKNKLSADAILDWGKRQPPNARACLATMEKLTTEEWVKIIAREELPISARGDLPSIEKEVSACFSDQDDMVKLLKEGTLTRRGVALLASRANAIFDADSFIASFVLKKIGNTDMFDRIVNAICRDDPQIIKKLPGDPRTQDTLGWLRRFIAAPHPEGCKGWEQAKT
jgi:hypothetical protein